MSITPDEFSRLLDMTTLPTVSEGANTIGQLYGKRKAFFTVGDVAQQLINIKYEINASNKWVNLVNNSTGVDVIKPNDITDPSSVVQEALTKAKDALFFSGAEISDAPYRDANKAKYKQSIINAAKVITEELSSDKFTNYIDVIDKLKKAFPNYIDNQVMMSFFLLCKADGHWEMLAKLQEPIQK